MNVLKYPDEWFKAMLEEGCAQVAGKQCSLIVWHPYPAEKPPVGTYIICCHDGAGDADMAFADYKADRFIGWGDKVFAWAIPPKPYEEK